ncbi:glycine-rich RNA-binding protein 4, mitochondrial-like [Actinidia eriantha]|uniref:glycine-rich RNA-binding protein 4, mitochondrial-like n=1 Tax=Actinidia eriantha TaxID=165200 RepID=UPI002588C868|nr:glycine-rich RNA-binding protein 4, mitochondrial-like [Actinidia eriantha]
MTLKQFVEQYENALTPKVEIEKLADMKSWKLACSLCGFQVDHVWTEYEVKELIIIGEGEEAQQKCVPFKVDFNAEINETQCICQLFECKGMPLNGHNIRVSYATDKPTAPRGKFGSGGGGGYRGGYGDARENDSF